ncbi:MAG TPA: AAA family ATPase, partial [Chloroflexota bacterium]|nr:AAA family ATPase [Chloroflexota bacterium]
MIDDSEWRRRKVKALIKLLALTPGHSLSREHLQEVLWENLEPDAASNNLRKAVHIARHALEPNLSGSSRFLAIQDDLLVLKADQPLWVDIEAFAALVADARGTRDPNLYEGAVEVYRGDLLPEDPYEDWTIRRREALREEYTAILLEVAELYVARDDPSRAIRALRRAVAGDPAHEHAHVALMTLYARTGRRHEALRQYQRLREALRQELEVEPGTVAEELNRQVLAELSSSRAHSSFPPTQTSPPGTERIPRFPRLVGRDREMDRLEDALDGLFEGKGMVILLTGEAGVGKTRLALEVARRGARRGALSLFGAAYEDEKQLAYGPFVEILEGVAGQMEGSELPILLEGIRPEITMLAPIIGLMLGSPASEGSGDSFDQQRLFTAVAEMLGRLETRAPIVIVLDDLHAADQASLQLLHHLARGVHSVPCLLVCTVQPEGMAPRGQIAQLLASLQAADAAAAFELRRLGRRDSEILVTTLLGDCPADRSVAECVYSLAAGNPFYTAETVRTLQEGGQVRQVDGRWQLASQVMGVPGPLSEHVMAHLGRLDPAALLALEILAVVGQEAFYPLLQAAADLPETALLEAIDDCLRRGILEDSPRGYRFGHSLYRAALYEGLSQARRANLHGRVAQAIEMLFAGRLQVQAEILAYHHGLSHEPGRALPH